MPHLEGDVGASPAPTDETYLDVAISALLTGASGRGETRGSVHYSR